jgi:hypothetical protein
MQATSSSLASSCSDAVEGARDALEHGPVGLRQQPVRCGCDG